MRRAVESAYTLSSSSSFWDLFFFFYLFFFLVSNRIRPKLDHKGITLTRRWSVYGRSEGVAAGFFSSKSWSARRSDAQRGRIIHLWFYDKKTKPSDPISFVTRRGGREKVWLSACVVFLFFLLLFFYRVLAKVGAKMMRTTFPFFLFKRNSLLCGGKGKNGENSGSFSFSYTHNRLE